MGNEPGPGNRDDRRIQDIRALVRRVEELVIRSAEHQRVADRLIGQLKALLAEAERQHGRIRARVRTAGSGD
jgi:hypothetical protein